MGIVQESEIEVGRFQCKCIWKRCGLDRKEYNYRRHMAGQCYQRRMREVREQGFEQATYAEIASTKAEREAERLEKEGTHSQASTDADVPFRKEIVKSFVGAGVPLTNCKSFTHFFRKTAISLSVIQHISLDMCLNWFRTRPHFRLTS